MVKICSSTWHLEEMADFKKQDLMRSLLVSEGTASHLQDSRHQALHPLRAQRVRSLAPMCVQTSRAAVDDRREARSHEPTQTLLFLSDVSDICYSS